MATRSVQDSGGEGMWGEREGEAGRREEREKEAGWRVLLQRCHEHRRPRCDHTAYCLAFETTTAGASLLNTHTHASGGEIQPQGGRRHTYVQGRMLNVATLQATYHAHTHTHTTCYIHTRASSRSCMHAIHVSLWWTHQYIDTTAHLALYGFLAFLRPRMLHVYKSWNKSYRRLTALVQMVHTVLTECTFHCTSALQHSGKVYTQTFVLWTSTCKPT